MRPRQLTRLAVDAAMMFVMPLLMAYSLVGEEAHEWLGVASACLIVIHHVLNRRRISALCRGRMDALRTLGAVVDALLAVVVLALFLSGIALSRHVVPFLDFPFDLYVARRLHLFSSHTGLVLMGIHLGLHLREVALAIRGAAGLRSVSEPCVLVVRAVVVLSCVYGAASFVQLGFIDYLTLRESFMFLDYSRPLVLVLADWLSVMCLFSGVGYMAGRLLAPKQKGAAHERQGS